MKLTKTTLDKLEKVFSETGYKIRYEKGNFRSGRCVVWQKKMIVISKFYPVEEKINALVEILLSDGFPRDQISSEQQAFITKLTQKNIFEQEA